MTRTDGRSAAALRPIRIELGIQRNPEGSVLYRCGGTSVLIAASITEGVPDWMKGRSSGWVTADYSMHPRCSPDRQKKGRDKLDGRASEIQRLVGRALRAAVDLDKLGPRTINLDCDVLDADGGTRTAAITGSYVAVGLALKKLTSTHLIPSTALKMAVAAISVGVIKGEPRLDLHYDDDKAADVDMNVVMTSQGQFVEVQGTAEAAPFDKGMLDQLLGLAEKGIRELFLAQAAALENRS